MIKHMIEGPLAGAKKREKSHRGRNRRILIVRTINNNRNSRFRRVCIRFTSSESSCRTLYFKRNRRLQYSCLIAVRFDGICAEPSGENRVPH